MASKKLPAKPTMREAFNAAQGPATERPYNNANKMVAKKVAKKRKMSK